MSAPHPWGAFHLLVADDALAEGHVYRCYLALCGVSMPASRLPPSSCPDEGDCEIRYCPACVRVAADWNAEAGQADRASGAEPSGEPPHEVGTVPAGLA